MIYLGKLQTLYVVKRTHNGVYLSSPSIVEPPVSEENKPLIVKAEQILLPKNQVDSSIDLGSKIEVFVYKDSEDRPIATTARPKVTFGQASLLTVKDVTNIGAFLDWGLAKDLFLPFKEQTYKVAVGDQVLVTLYVDKSQRLCATMKVYNSLSTTSPYTLGEHVSGTVYEVIEAFGAYVAVDNKYSAMIPNSQLFKTITPGEHVEARITTVHPDGKLELSLREKSYMQLDPDSEVILKALNASKGFLPYHDKSNPEAIKAKFNLSKAAFKRAIGHLYKEGKIIISENGISLTKNDK